MATSELNTAYTATDFCQSWVSKQFLCTTKSHSIFVSFLYEEVSRAKPSQNSLTRLCESLCIVISRNWALANLFDDFPLCLLEQMEVRFLIRVFFGYKPYWIKYLGSATGLRWDWIAKWKYWTRLGLRNLRYVQHWQADMWAGLADQARLQVRKDGAKEMVVT